MLSNKTLLGTGAETFSVSDVFSITRYTGTGSAQTVTNNIDTTEDGGLVWIKRTNNGNRGHVWFPANVSGLASGYFFTTSDTISPTSITLKSTDDQEPVQDSVTSFSSSGFTLGNDGVWGAVNEYGTSANHVSFSFKKKRKFFDVIAYTGTGIANTQNVSHSLESTPGFIIIKQVVGSGKDWICRHKDATGELFLNTTAIEQSSFTKITAVSSSTFSVTGDLNTLSTQYLAYLFASDAGGFGLTGNDSIVKCGSYIGDGTFSRTISTGFEAQWIMVKNADQLSNWAVTDLLDGKTSLANTKTTESTSTIFSTSSSGFSLISDSYNSSGMKYIYVAIAKES